MTRARDALGAMLLLAAGLILTALVIDRAVPEDIDDLMTAKLKVFERHKDDYTAVFIGDSRAYREIVPPRFDETLGASGARSRSFNLAAPGMCLFEAHHLLTRLAGLRPERLRYVFLGAHTLPDILETDANTRTVYWRTLEETALETASVIGASTLTREVRWRLLYNAWRLFIFRALNRGRLSSFLANAAAWRELARSYDMENRQGHFPLELDDFYVYVRYHEQFVRDGPQAFAARLAAWKNGEPERPDMSGAQRRGYEAIRSLAREQGWKLIFIGEIFQRHAPTGCETPASDCALLEFNDIGRYGEFFRYDQFYDASHLTQDASLRFTTLLARRFLELEGAPLTEGLRGPILNR